MKILLLFPRPLLPADNGGKIRSLNIFSRLAQRAEVHAISFADPDNESDAVAAMRRMFHSYHPVYWREAAKYTPAFYFSVLTNQISRLPYFLAKCDVERFRWAAYEVASRHRCDLIFCDFLQSAVPLLSSGLRPLVVFEHNVEFLLRKRQYQVERNPARRFVLRREWQRTRRIEERICQSCDHVIAVSSEDCRVLRNEFRLTNVSIVPTGVDTCYFQPLPTPAKPGKLVFVGSMDWYPNDDGVIWFLSDIYPKIRNQAPHVMLWVVGRNPSPRLRELAKADSGVVLTGRVTDVRPYIADAELVIVPLRVGGGTRIKIPEAMAMRKAVVSTRIGAEGLPFTDGREIQLVDEPDRFAAAVLELMRDGAQRKSIARAARECVEQKHSWDVVVDCLERILLQVSRPQHARSPAAA